MRYDVEEVIRRFRIKGGRVIGNHVRDVTLRWLRRGTNRRVNGPSLRLETEYDVVHRQLYLYASASSVTGAAPQFLEDVAVKEGEFLL